MRNPVAAAIAIAVGLVILAGYFIPLGILGNVRTYLLDWAIGLAGVASLVAIINLLTVHGRKIRDRREPDRYSILLIIAFVITFIVGMVFGPSSGVFQNIITSIQIPIEASLMAVLAISLTYASLRLFKRRKGWMALLFVFSTVVFLVIGSGFLSIGSQIPLLRDILGAINMLPIAGARGILLGVALGGLTTGLRILMGADRPYSG
jgi:hypothetical protein